MRRALAGLAAGLAVVLTGCGVPQDDAPRALDRDGAPFGIFASESVAPPQGELQAELWFVQGSQAVPVRRSLEAPGSPMQVVEQLLRGPTEDELAAGLSTSIPSSLTLSDVTVDDGIAVVTLEGLTEQVRVEAYAQIVATLDGRPGIEGVRFRDEDGDVDVPNGDGVLGGGAVTRDDYAVLLGLEPAPTGSSAAAVPPPPPPAPTPSPG